MTPKERVMTALRRGKPDQVPWVENEVEELLQIQIMGGRTDYTPGELCRALGMDGFGYHFPTGAAGSASPIHRAFHRSTANRPSHAP